MSDQPKPTTGESANVHIHHYFPKGYNPDEEPWKSIKAHHNAALTSEREKHAKALLAKQTRIEIFQEQLAAEREKVQTLITALKRMQGAVMDGLPVQQIGDEALIEVSK